MVRPQRAGQGLLSALVYWGAWAKRVQCLALMFWDATAYTWHHPLLLQDRNPLGRRPGYLYVLVLECWSLHDAEDRAIVSTTTGKLQEFFSALMFMILPSKRSPFIKCECSHFYACQILQLGELDPSSVSLFLVIKPNLDTSTQYLQRGFRWFCGTDVAGPYAWS